MERGSLGRLGPPWAARDVVNTKHSECYGTVRSLKGSLRLDSHGLSHSRFFSLVGYVASLVWGSWSRLAGHVASDLGCRRLLQMSIGCLRGHRGSSWASQKHPGGPDGSRGAQRNFEVAWGQLLLHRPAVLCWGSTPRGYHGAQRSPEDASRVLNSPEEFSVVLTAPEGPARIPHWSRWFLRSHAGSR